MTEKTAQQINRMKEQTIGVEVEMNNITRKAAAKLAAEFFEQTAASTPHTGTATKPTAHGTHRDASGNSSATAASADRTAKNANWSHRSCTTRTSKACRS